MTMGKRRPLSAAAKKELKAETDKIFTLTGFKKTKTLSQGPRYQLVLGTHEKKKAVLKICLRPIPEDKLTNEKLTRETVFLQYIHDDVAPLAATVPKIIAADSKPRAWYIREYLPGTPWHPPKNEVLFKKDFFTDANRKWVAGVLHQLQSITARDLPQQFNELLYRPELPSRLWNYVAEYADKIDSFMDTPGISATFKAKFTRANPLFRNAPNVLAHQELYPTHILKSKNQSSIIDWENVGWALPTYDYVVLWLRAHEYPEWQSALRREYLQQYEEYRDAERLWDTTVYIQSVFNVVGYHFYPGKKKFEPLANYCADYLLDHLS